MLVLAPAASKATASVFTLAIVAVLSLLVIWNTLGKFEAEPAPMLETLAENDLLSPTMP